MPTTIPPQQIEVRNPDRFGTCGCFIWTSEILTTGKFATEYFADGEWRPIPAEWRDKRNWIGVRWVGKE